MGRIRGFRCGRCRAEVLATSGPPDSADRAAWSPPVLCCGEALRPLETSQIASILLARRRLVCCPQCGYQLHVIVHPAETLVCQICQKAFTVTSGTPLGHAVNRK